MQRPRGSLVKFARDRRTGQAIAMRACILAACTVAACANDGGGQRQPASSGAVTTVGATQTDGSSDVPADTSPATTGQTAGDGDAGEVGGDPDDPGGPGDAVFDIGAASDTTTGAPYQGCTNVDFLFVIDNSESMENNQANLVDNFPHFIHGIQNSLPGVDGYHVGVVTTDDYQGNPTDCRILGSLVTRTAGANSSGESCGPYAAGHDFMTELDDLENSFSCAARVGTDGFRIERPMNAIESVLGKEPWGGLACNDEFVRDDALLVVVVITDEWDGPNDAEGASSNGDPSSWYETVVDAKNGLAQNVVVVSLVHTTGCLDDFGYGSGSIQPFTEMFGDNGFVGCIDGDYEEIFDDAIEVIHGACDGFDPPG